MSLGYIDRTLKAQAKEFIGDVVDTLTDEQIENARCESFKMLDDLTAKYGRQEKGTLEELFNNYLWSYYI